MNSKVPKPDNSDSSEVTYHWLGFNHRFSSIETRIGLEVDLHDVTQPLQVKFHYRKYLMILAAAAFFNLSQYKIG